MLDVLGRATRERRLGKDLLEDGLQEDREEERLGRGTAEGNA